MPAKFVPEGHTTVVPYLTVEDAAKCLEFIQKGFSAGAKEIERHTAPDGRVQHAEVKLFDCLLMIGQATGEGKAMPATLYVYVEDVDLTFKSLIEAGAAVIREPRDEGYGHRTGGVRDPHGNCWWLAHPAGG